MKKSTIKEKIVLALVIICALLAIQVYIKRGMEGRFQVNKDEWDVGDPSLYTVVEVVDGDTLKVGIGNKVETVQLIGIDAPEASINDKVRRDAERTGQDLETITKMGQEAKKFTENTLLSGGNTIRLEFDAQERDKYGRLLAYVYIPGERFHKTYEGVYVDVNGEKETFLNVALIAHGYAQPMTIPPNVKYADLFKKLYQEARENKRGLWKK